MLHVSKSTVLCTLTSSGEERVGTGGIVVAELQRSRRVEKGAMFKRRGSS